MKESTGGEELSKIDLGVYTINQVEKEANSIFDDVIEEKNLSEYYLKETMFKIIYLKEQILEGLSKVESGLIDECKKSNKSNLLIPFIAILNIFVMIVLPLLGLINMLLLTSSLIKSVKIQKSEYEKFIKLKQDIEDIVAKANSIQITLSPNFSK